MSILSDISRPSGVRSFNIKDRFTANETCSAFKGALTYMISDSFNLTDEETIWAGYQIKQVLSVFEETYPQALPNAVSHELLTKQYSKSVMRRKDGIYLSAKDGGEPADLKSWVNVIMDMVDSAYRPDPFEDARIRAQFTSILEDLGVGKSQNPRAALYLPNAIRWNAAQSKNKNAYSF